MLRVRHALFATIVIVACKPASSQMSDAKSLDNFAAKDGAALVQNDCAGPYVNTEYAGAEHIDAPPELRGDVDKALSAIPLTLRELFSTKMIGQITVARNAAQLCGAALQNISENRLKAANGVDTTTCLRGTAGEPGIELVLPANAKSIHHSLVRAFFAATFRVMASAEYDTKLKIFKAGKLPPEFPAIEKALAVALRQDLKAINGDAKRQREIFGAALAAATDPNAMNKAFDAMSPEERDVVGLAVVRESADQYYCSAKTRQVMRAKYPKTYQAFKAMWVTMAHQELEEKNPEELLGETPAVAASAAAAQPASLGLWGGFGAGNGPLRAWVGSRLDARSEGGGGLFPNWNLARQEGAAAGGAGVFPNWNAARQDARGELQSSGLPGASLFPGFWRNRLLGGEGGGDGGGEGGGD